MRKKFIINLAFLILLNVLIKPFWIFGVERSVQNIVGSAEFGFYFSLFNFSLLLNIILDLGITNFNNRNISQNPQLLRKHVSNIVSLKLILAVFYAVLTIGAAFVIGYDSRQLGILFILILNQFLSSLVLYLRSNISGLQLFKTDSLISVLDRFIMILVCSILIWGNVTDKPLKIEWFVLTQTFAYLTTALVTFIIVIYKAKFFKLNFDFRFFRVFLKQSYPYALLILLMAFYNRIDSVMLERLLPDGKHQAGIYAQAYRILEAASMFPYLFSILLLPMFSKMLKKKESITELAKLSFSMILVPAIFLVSVCCFFSDQIMDLMYWEHVDVSSQTLSFLMIGFIGISTTYIFGTLLTANGSMKQLNTMAFIGMILNITLNLILVPRLQVKGSAIAGMITQLFTGFTQLILAKYIFKFKINYKLIFSITIFIVIVILSTVFLSKLNINWIKTVLIIGIISLLASFATGLFKVKVLYQLLKERE
ncbi:MAG: oligosaccharide flippase family protein [Bacteroidales bacterium]|nr:oligosaccharide flippase family protein [Bacteroidales bacterium]NLB86695.1 oligosaccharide flippase family protein [Bacteroidales bacterium]